MTFTASDVLLKAASRIEEEGMWCQGNFFDGLDVETIDVAFQLRQTFDERLPECAMGALISATVDLGLSIDDLNDALERFGHVTVGSSFALWVARWNDVNDRTAHEVAEAMRQAAL